MDKNKRITKLIVLLSAIILILGCVEKKVDAPSRINTQKDTITIAGLEWQTNISKAYQISQEQNKSLFLYFTPLQWQEEYTANYSNANYEWKGDYSYQFQKWILRNSSYSLLLKNNFIIVVLDSEGEKKEVIENLTRFFPNTFTEHDLDFIRAGVYPKLYILTPRGNLTWILGFSNTEEGRPLIDLPIP